MTDSGSSEPGQDDDDVLKHSRALEQVDTTAPAIIGPYVPGGADLPSQVEVEPPRTEAKPSQLDAAASSGDE